MFRYSIIRRLSTIIILVAVVSVGSVLVQALVSNSLTRSSIRLAEPNTGCEVILVGCFHGSPTSAADVREALDLLSLRIYPSHTGGVTRIGTHQNEGPAELPTRTTSSDDVDNAVVLELCASRYEDLMKQQFGAAASYGRGEESGKNNNQQQTPWIVRYVKNIQTTAWTKGLSSAAATAFLTGASGLQSSEIEPGLEFKTALDIAKERQIDVILADQSVDVTIEKLGRLPQTALTVLQSNEWWFLATALAGATIGLKSYHLSLPMFLMRSKEAIGDAMGFFFRPLGLILALQLALSTLDAATGLDVAVADTHSSGDWGPVLNAALILGLYTVLALPATKIVVSDRDDVLTKGIQTACRGRKRVVAVLGLLHVNGVADRLIAAGLQPTSHMVETAGPDSS